MSEKPKRNIIPVGEEVVAAIEATGTKIPDWEREELLKISDDEAMRQLMEANLGDTMNVSRLTANSVFSGWLTKKLNIVPMLMTFHFDNLEQSTRAIEYCREILDQKGLDGKWEMAPEERASFAKLLILAIKERGLLIKNALQLTQHLLPKDAPKRVYANRPPDVLNQVNVSVQNVPAEVKVVETESKPG